MKPSLSFVTLGVADLERSLRFYRDGLGLPTQGIVGEEFETGAVAFFDMNGGMKLALWPQASLAKEVGMTPAPPSPAAFSLAHNVASRAEVDALIRDAAAAGARIVRRPCETFYGGYAGWFADPDGHLWEIAWNPAFAVPDA